MRLHPNVRKKTYELLGRIHQLLSRNGVRQVWVFGSASRGEGRALRDIDVALICRRDDAFPELTEALTSLFPSSAVEHGRYTRTPEKSPGGPPFHFVLATAETLSQMSKLSSSIRSGMRVIG
jgi:predicted nucleotidyltransferase